MKKYTMQFSEARVSPDGTPYPVRGVHSQYQIVRVLAEDARSAARKGYKIVRARRPEREWLIDGGAEEMRDRQMGFRIG
ncbi:MAG: hypothetical protein PHW65_04615 [Dehalococcoidales bacterium]|nr:hypothetical protein [Dehalococcoidales bacterium]